jgi:hypothetical protein
MVKIREPGREPGRAPAIAARPADCAYAIIAHAGPIWKTPTFGHNFKDKLFPFCKSLYFCSPMAVTMPSLRNFVFVLSTAWPLISATIPPISDTLTAAALPAQVNISQTLTDPFPYYFPDENEAEMPALFPMPPCHGVTLEEATIDQLQDYMGQGILSSVQIALCYLERIWQTNDYIK